MATHFVSDAFGGMTSSQMNHPVLVICKVLLLSSSVVNPCNRRSSCFSGDHRRRLDYTILGLTICISVSACGLHTGGSNRSRSAVGIGVHEVSRWDPISSTPESRSSVGAGRGRPRRVRRSSSGSGGRAFPGIRSHRPLLCLGIERNLQARSAL